MNFITNLFTMKELIIMGSVIGGLLIIIIIMTIITMLDKKKDDLELSELEEEDKDVSILAIDDKKEEFVEPVLIEKKKEVHEEMKVEKKEEIHEEVKIENKEEIPLIMDVEDDVKDVQVDTTMQAKLELQKIEKELENPKSLEDTINNLEAMEEESAIISYQELLETTKEMNIIQTDTGDELISINELLRKYNDENVEKEMTKLSIDEAYKGEDFINSPCVSPIEGVENQNLNEIQLENTANLEKLDKEIRKTNEFLNILNELKKNLE